MRAFVALPIDAFSQRAIADSIEPFRRELGGQDVRWVRPEHYHVTLAFLGDVPDERIDDLVGALSEVRFDAFEMACAGWGAFPNWRAPRVLWLGLDRPEVLHALAARIRQVLDDAGFDYDRKPLRAHLTIGRVQRGASEPEDALHIDLPVADSFVLMRSDLTADGPAYSVVREFGAGS